MNFEVYCDESCLEALKNKTAHAYTVIGGIWIEASRRKELKSGLSAIKARYKVGGELKWNKVSPAYFELYKEIIDFFFSTSYIRFRAIVIEAGKTSEYKFHHSDVELEFYKFYYQLLHHWILDFNTYDIFVDLKVNRNKGRLNELCKVLNNANLVSTINQVQGLPSEQSLGIQLADVLTGIVAAKFNNEIKSSAKSGLIAHIEESYLKGRPIAHTSKTEEKFNVFKINLQGGW